MSLQEIARLWQIVTELTKKRNQQGLVLRRLQNQPPESPIRAKMKILCQSMRRIELEIHMHERQIERLRQEEGS
jgi:hypothetical protein